MFYEFQGTPKQVHLVTTLADQCYIDFAKERDLPPTEKVYRGPYCKEISEMLIGRLRKSGYFAQPRQYGLWHRHIDLGSDWIVDPTWQQFPIRLKKRDLPALPRVLIIQKPLLAMALTNFGILPEDLMNWTEARILNVGIN